MQLGQYFSQFVLMGFLVLSTACTLGLGSVSSTPTPALPTPVTIPSRTPEPASPESRSTPAPAVERLTVWLLSDISVNAETAEGVVLTEQLTIFDDNHPHFELSIERKMTTGQGGIISYLQTGDNIAPAILPDLIILPTEQIPEAVDNDLIYPLDNLLDEADQNDLYPVSQMLGRIDESLYAYPYALMGFTHLAYDATFTQTVPSRWGEFLDTTAAFVFPADSRTGGDLLLQFYLAEEGMLIDPLSNEPLLETEPLIRALQQIDDGWQNNLIFSQSHTSTDLRAAWLVYQNSKANVTLIDVELFLQQRAATPEVGFAAVPGPAGPLAPQLTGWAWAISTPDPARQALAAELLTWLIDAPNLGEWSAEARYLPARRAAFDQWPPDPYTTFLQNELERATTYPTVANGVIADTLQDAMFALTSPSGETPEVLADRASQAVAP